MRLQLNLVLKVSTSMKFILTVTFFQATGLKRKKKEKKIIAPPYIFLSERNTQTFKADKWQGIS